jgi:hypothetical protein
LPAERTSLASVRANERSSHHAFVDTVMPGRPAIASRTAVASAGDHPFRSMSSGVATSQAAKTSAKVTCAVSAGTKYHRSHNRRVGGSRFA